MYLHVFYFRKWLPEIPQAADWSTPGLIGELTPPPSQDTAVSNYPFLLKLYKSQCSVQEREILEVGIAERHFAREFFWEDCRAIVCDREICLEVIAERFC